MMTPTPWLLPILLAIAAEGPASGPVPPRPTSSSLVVELVAAEPEIVTPTGLAVDSAGRAYVAESHTHFRPEGYEGPAADRIRLFEDADGDGRFERIDTVHEGLTHTMSLAFEADGALLVATRAEVLRLRLGPDGKATSREPIARLETPGDYPHNGISGLAIAFDGTIWFGLGENLGAPYRLVGRDGTTLSGGGEGGNLYRIQVDGSGLERVATGFWNPFGLAIDPFGRVFAVDNDPDSRPPCRLLHIVEGGDYGFRFRHGRDGLNPLTAWDGDLPGTLPMVAGTGEAPSGIVAYDSDGLTEADRGALLVTSWGDHRIDRFRLEPRGASFRARREPMIVGDEHFRPVALAVGPDGSLFVTDWVNRSYSVHGKGRLWRIRRREAESRPPSDGLVAVPGIDRASRDRAARSLAATEEGRRALLDIQAADPPEARARALEAIQAAVPGATAFARLVSTETDPALLALAVRLLPAKALDLPRLAGPSQVVEVRAEALRRLASPDALPSLKLGLESDDPFLRLAAREGLRRSLDVPGLLALARSKVPAHRLGALLALAVKAPETAVPAIARALADPDPTVRLAAVRLVADHDLVVLEGDLPKAVRSGVVGDRLFRAHLAALALLERGGKTGALAIEPKTVVAMAFDPDRAASVRALALRLIEPNDPALNHDRLAKLLGSPEPSLRLEALRKVIARPDHDRFGPLERFALDLAQPLEIRAEAVAGLASQAEAKADLLLGLLKDPEPAIRRQAARSLRGVALSTAQLARVEAAGLTRLQAPGDDSWASTLRDEPDRLGSPGDPAEGARVFFHPKGPACFRCHVIEGRGGGLVGPDLSLVARGSDRDRLIESILDPSREIAPQFTPYLVTRPDGTLAQGLLVVEQGDGTNLYRDSDGHAFTISAADRLAVRPLDTSIMPDGLARLMTPRELRDLIAFLLDPGEGSSDPIESRPQPKSDSVGE